MLACGLRYARRWPARAGMSLHRIGARLGVVTAHAMAVVNGATSLCIEIELQSIVDQFVHSLRCCVHRGCSGKDHADCCCSESPCVAQLAHELPFEEMARPDNVRRGHGPIARDSRSAYYSRTSVSRALLGAEPRRSGRHAPRGIKWRIAAVGVEQVFTRINFRGPRHQLFDLTHAIDRHDRVLFAGTHAIVRLAPHSNIAWRR